MELMRVLEEKNLELNDAPGIVWVRVQDVLGLLWLENPKLHDIGSICESISRYGFQELPKFDKNLPNSSGGMGAIKSGNGRVEALVVMERSKDYSLPRGLAMVVDSKDWVMPLLVGTDGETMNAARAYAIDSNNLTMLGGDFTSWDVAGLWNKEGYEKLLRSLSDNKEDMPVSLPLEDFDALLTAWEKEEVKGSGLEKLGEDLGIVGAYNVIDGDVFEISKKHILVCCDPFYEWYKFISYLSEGKVLVIYPDYMVIQSILARDKTLVLVQPIISICEWMLNAYSKIYGEGSIIKIE